jgi:hypothetical protein
LLDGCGTISVIASVVVVVVVVVVVAWMVARRT